MKKKELIILGSILLLTIIVIVATIVIIATKEKDTNKEIDSTIYSLFDNAYKYYYYMYGDIKIGDGFVESDGETYYAVLDEEILSIDNINDLVKETFVKEKVSPMLNVENKNIYFVFKDTLYVQKSENVCKNIKEYNFDNLNYLYNDEKIEVKFDSTSTNIYNEDGDWKLGTNIYFCSDK